MVSTYLHTNAALYLLVSKACCMSCGNKNVKCLCHQVCRQPVPGWGTHVPQAVVRQHMHLASGASRSSMLRCCLFPGLLPSALPARC